MCEWAPLHGKRTELTQRREAEGAEPGGQRGRTATGGSASSCRRQYPCLLYRPCRPCLPHRCARAHRARSDARFVRSRSTLCQLWRSRPRGGIRIHDTRLARARHTRPPRAGSYAGQSRRWPWAALAPRVQGRDSRPGSACEHSPRHRRCLMICVFAAGPRYESKHSEVRVLANKIL